MPLSAVGIFSVASVKRFFYNLTIVLTYEITRENRNMICMNLSLENKDFYSSLFLRTGIRSNSSVVDAYLMFNVLITVLKINISHYLIVLTKPQ